MNAFMKTQLMHWKTTAQSAITAFLGFSGTILAVKANPAIDPSLLPIVNAIPAKWLIIIGTVSGVIKLVIGFMQKDPDTVLAKVPGIKEPQVVSAHATPDDPKAVPVVDK
jgi:hypothetical protein